MSAPQRSSSRIRRQQTYDCFGNYDADISEELLHALGKLSAIAMLTTQRVGLVTEDASMSQAR